jgi:uncharacterized protein YgbK (DUF1537 family)
MPLLLGCIADDITGASDLGLMLTSNGLPATLFLGIPDAAVRIRTPAVVIALKIRTCPAEDAVAQALAAAEWLLARSARQLFYKYCSTFDSTSQGNIGPVTDALMNTLDESLTVLLPALPVNGRTVRNGHLFVGEQPLSESSMRDHPLTPMTESFLPALMDKQTGNGLTGWIGQDTVDAGAGRIRSELDAQAAAGLRYVSIDTREDNDLKSIADAIAHLRLITGGSGIAAAIPETLRRQGLVTLRINMSPIPKLPGHAAVLAGSCSQATRAQVAAFENSAGPIIVDPLALHSGAIDKTAIAAAAVAASNLSDVLVYSSTDPQTLQRSQASLGVATSASLVEETLAFVARSLSESGIRKFMIAGGETSGAIAQALEVNELQFGAEIDPGVPWMISTGPLQTCLAFKSGNFGKPDFFQRALDLLP